MGEFKVIVGLVVVYVSFKVFGFLGLLSIFIVLPAIGWSDRHKGPYFVPTEGTTDYTGGIDFIQKFPSSGRMMQDLLVKISKGQANEIELKNELGTLLNSLKIEKYNTKYDTDNAVLMGFVNQFSSYFPNWKPEYQMICRVIGEHFQ